MSSTKSLPCRKIPPNRHSFPSPKVLKTIVHTTTFTSRPPRPPRPSDLIFHICLPMAANASRPVPIDPKYDDYDYPTISTTTQSGHPGHTTAEQDAKVAQLRMMLEQAGCKDRLDTLTLVFGRASPSQCRIVAETQVYSCGSYGPESLTFNCPSRCNIYACG